MTAPLDPGERSNVVVTALAKVLTADQLVNGIANSLAAHQVDHVGYFLEALVRVDPQRAQQMVETMRVGLALRDEQDAGGTPT